jgi:hypothetical protein
MMYLLVNCLSFLETYLKLTFLILIRIECDILTHLRYGLLYIDIFVHQILSQLNLVHCFPCLLINNSLRYKRLKFSCLKKLYRALNFPIPVVMATNMVVMPCIWLEVAYTLMRSLVH